ncbi:hypothetical protein H0H92_008447 [Tricholoma furcatifolium]|nr:hypothetical protein H0H92_008447 [Tricholoma furcatifolium]
MAGNFLPRMSFSALPHEVLDQILCELDRVEDLLSLAFTSRANASLVIPSHSEYRQIRVRTSMPAMWAHLASRADLARNIHQVQLCARQDYTAPDRFPVTLVEDSLHHSDEEKRVSDICLALRHMTKLTTFVWDYVPDIKAGRVINHFHEEMILLVLKGAPNLRHIMLKGKCGAHVRGRLGFQGQPYPLWDITNLESLSLLGSVGNRVNSVAIIRLIQRSPNLQYLEVPVELQGLDTCHLPRLKRVRLPMTSGSFILGGTTADPVVRFLENNSTIEELNWSVLHSNPSELSPNALPNLKRLTSNNRLFRHFEDRGDIHRPVECLDLWDADSEFLSNLHTCDVTALRKLKIADLPPMKFLHIVAERFTGLTWLRLPPVPWDSQSLTLEDKLHQLLELLSSFKNLEVLRGHALWNAVGGATQKERMHEAILDVIEHCPKLRELDHCDTYEKRQAFKIIKIFRKVGPDGELEQAWYEVRRPPPMYVLCCLQRFNHFD